MKKSQHSKVPAFQNLLTCYGRSVPRRPKSNDKTTNTRKIKNITFAMDAAPAAIPVKPNIAAIIAITIKMIVQRNIGYRFK